MTSTPFDRGPDDECAACGDQPDVLHASGEALSALLCEGCMGKAQAEHERRCSMCGITEAWIAQFRALGSSRRDPAWQDVAGRPVCNEECAEKEAARQAAEAEPSVVTLDEIDGVWAVDVISGMMSHRQSMRLPVRLYLDDVRNPPDDGGGSWTVCRTLDEAKGLLLSGVDEASLDHDLGQCDACASDIGPNNCPHIGTGYDLVKWMAEHGAWPRLKPRVHSANPVGRAAMVQMIERHWRTT